MILDQYGQPMTRASIENPSTSLSDPAVFDLLDVTTTEAGVRINRLTALGHSPIWRGVNLLARDVAKLPLITYRRQGEGKERATDHPAYRLLRSRPNREMTAFTFKEILIAHAVLQGNGYAYILRDSDRGVPLELIPLLPHETWPVRASGVLYYVTRVNGKMERYDAANVLHIKGLGYDGLVGYSVINLAAEALGLGLAARSYGSRFFSNNANPDLVIEVPASMDDKAIWEMLRTWDRRHKGLRKSHRPAVLTNGAKVNPYSVDAKRSQLLETRGFDFREVANFLCVPPHKVGDTSRQGYASLEQENQSYLDEALDPWLVRFEEEVRAKLLTEKEQDADQIVIEFLRQALVRADMAARGAFYAAALGGMPYMTRDEVRGRENLNPLGGAAGKLADPANLVGAAGSTDAGGDPADDPTDGNPAGDPTATGDEVGRANHIRAVTRNLLVDQIRRAVTRLSKDLERVRRQPDQKRDLVAAHAEAIAGQLGPALELCAAMSESPAARALCADPLRLARGLCLLTESGPTDPEIFADQILKGTLDAP